jgi:hypothetical protein
MPAIAQGIYKQTRYKRQTGVGAIASGGTGGQILRRKMSTFEQKRQVYATLDEIASFQQLISERQGVQQVDGKLDALFSPGTYSDLFGALLRRDFAVGATTGAIITVAVATTTGAAGTFTLSAGSFLTMGFKVGDGVRCAGWTAPALTNNAQNYLITGLTATVMTVLAVNGVPLITKIAGDTVTISLPGKKTFVPSSGHTNIYYTIEDWDSQVLISEVSQDVKIGSCALTMPGNGNVTASFVMVGLSQLAPATTVYFAAPTVETTSNVVASATGVLMINGVVSGLVTGLNFTINGQETPADGVVGTRNRPDIFRKKVLVSGSTTIYITDSSIDNYARNETEISISVLMTTDATSAGDFIAITMPRVKLQASAPGDGEIGRIRTYQFTALYNSLGGTGVASEQTVFSMQDTLAP